MRARPEDWWRVRGVGDGVTHIDEPHIREFYRCNVWHVRGRDTDMLVDSGMGVVSLRDRVPLVTERPLQAVASHTHFDHIGLHHEFPCRLCHAAEAHLLRAPTRENTFADKYVTEEIFTQLPPEPFACDTYAVAAAPAQRLLWDGDVVDLGDRQFQVIHTPGHSPGGIALLDESDGILLAGDVIYDDSLLDDLPGSNIPDYLTSMQRLLDLDCRLILAGHGAPFDQARMRDLALAYIRSKT